MEKTVEQGHIFRGLPMSCNQALAKKCCGGRCRWMTVREEERDESELGVWRRSSLVNSDGGRLVTMAHGGFPMSFGWQCTCVNTNRSITYSTHNLIVACVGSASLLRWLREWKTVVWTWDFPF